MPVDQVAFKRSLSFLHGVNSITINAVTKQSQQGFHHHIDTMLALIHTLLYTSDFSAMVFNNNILFLLMLFK